MSLNEKLKKMKYHKRVMKLVHNKQMLAEFLA